MDDMRSNGLKPNTSIYHSVFIGLREEEEPLKNALALMDRMTEHWQACNPGYTTMEILTNWLSAVGESKKLKTLLNYIVIHKLGKLTRSFPVKLIIHVACSL